ncbi:serine/threonine-protein kinase [Cohnella cholangitidis]|uniref:Protein kinase domain-containing protein n=1 Tax=Cohnella cholangitidis TaxID=2598458 RepID=A0A7G5BU44_9BACL|nr:hypothetical protein [Cohnella cholangitidis]QMV40478.1 hypothetical protein FPL14_04115 [Cohnella cholangitidis]
MSFQPEVRARLSINGKPYTIGEHPHAAGVPYGQEGRQGIVYLLNAEESGGPKAMKVFRSKFINPSLVFHTDTVAKYKGVAGLSACERSILTPQNHADLLNREPDLLYAVVMPWIEGPTWMDVLLAKQRLSKKQSFAAAFALAHVLMDMEQRGLAHCDLSATNVMLPMLSTAKKVVKPVEFVQLIDLEQMFSTHLEKPEHIPAGSPGYAIRNKTQSLMWSGQSDRFAGAILLAEMLASCSDAFVRSVWGESYFDPEELQTGCDRFDELVEMIRTIWGEALAALFVRAWESEHLSQCPPFGEWLMALSKIEGTVGAEVAATAAPVAVPSTSLSDHTETLSGPAPRAASPRPPAPAVASAPRTAASADSISQSDGGGFNANLLQKAKNLEQKKNYKQALEVYRSIQTLNAHSSLAKEVEIAIQHIEEILSRNKKKRDRAETSRKIKRVFLTLAFIVLLGLVGFLSKAYLDKQAVGSVESLTEDLKEKDKEIAQLTKQLKALDLSAKKQEMLKTLEEDYSELQRIANADPALNDKLDVKTFAAAQLYLNHMNEYLMKVFEFDQPFVDRTKIVEGYYFPYVYNQSRDPKRNVSFHKEYMHRF